MHIMFCMNEWVENAALLLHLSFFPFYFLLKVDYYTLLLQAYIRACFASTLFQLYTFTLTKPFSIVMLQ